VGARAFALASAKQNESLRARRQPSAKKAKPEREKKKRELRFFLHLMHNTENPVPEPKASRNGEMQGS
jgi:hypothetical protein